MAVGYTPVGDDLYREIILDHYRNPRGRGAVADADVRAEGSNPLCGDEVELTWRLDGDRLAEIGFTGTGCSICVSSASMLCDGVRGASANAAADLAHRFRAMLLNGGTSDDLGDLEALQGVGAYPVRIKCAILPWNTLLEGLGLSAEDRT